MECLVHWTKEGRWDVLGMDKIPTELCHEGALGLIQYHNGQRYLGKVIKISDDPAEIEEAEAKLAHAIKAAKDTVVLEAKQKRKRSKPAALGVASPNKVARSLGEKPVLTEAQKEVKKKAQEVKRKLKADQKKTEDEQDSQVLKSVNRRLRFDNDSKTAPISQSNNGEPSADSTSKKPSCGPSVTLVPKSATAGSSVTSAKSSTAGLSTALPSKSTNAVASKPTSGDAISDEDIVENGKEDSEAEMDDDGTSSEDDTNTESDPDLRQLLNPNTEFFIRCLLTKFGSKSSSSKPKLYAKVKREPGQRLTHLKKGYAMKVSKGIKNILMVDKTGQKSASNFTRKVLTQLYGQDQLMQMTAMGRKKNALSLSPDDLNSIYGFVTDLCPNDNFSWNDYIKTVNKKCSSYKTPSPKQVNKKSKPAAAASVNDEQSEDDDDDDEEGGAVVASPRKFRNSITVTTLQASPTKNSTVIEAESISTINFEEQEINRQVSNTQAKPPQACGTAAANPPHQAFGSAVPNPPQQAFGTVPPNPPQQAFGPTCPAATPVSASVPNSSMAHQPSGVWQQQQQHTAYQPTPSHYYGMAYQQCPSQEVSNNYHQVQSATQSSGWPVAGYGGHQSTFNGWAPNNQQIF